MTLGVALLAWAGLLAFGFPIAMNGATWPLRAPRLAVLAWQLASISYLAAVAFGVVALVVPGNGLPAEVPHLFGQCVSAYHQATESAAGIALCLTVSALAFGLLGRIGWCLTRTLRRTAHRRAMHRHGLRMVARPHPTLGVLVVDHPIPAAYSLPGRGGTIVLTTAAVRNLHPTEMQAVLAHERAHARGHHHLWVTLSGALHSAFPRVPLLRRAAAAVSDLVEMAADDTAARVTGTEPVLSALIAFSGASAPTSGALAMAGTTTRPRLQRLAFPVRPLGPRGVLAPLALAAGLLGVPAGLAFGPGITASRPARCCADASTVRQVSPGLAAVERQPVPPADSTVDLTRHHPTAVDSRVRPRHSDPRLTAEGPESLGPVTNYRRSNG